MTFVPPKAGDIVPGGAVNTGGMGSLPGMSKEWEDLFLGVLQSQAQKAQSSPRALGGGGGMGGISAAAQFKPNLAVLLRNPALSQILLGLGR